VQKIHVPSKLHLIFNIHETFMNFLYTLKGKTLLLFILYFTCSASLFAQQKTKIILQSSERSRIITKTDITYLRKPTFRQDNAILTCDSAVFYTSKNYFEAYNNVHINQADTINIYSDRLTYDGNAKLAHLSSNVRLVDKTSVLTTNVLDYNMVSKVGTYVDGGKIVNKDATITSKNGYYFANSRDAYFRYNVLVVTEQSTIKSDTLRYNTFSNWAYFYGPTNIKEKDGNLYTENGAYNTKTTYAYFGKKNLYTSGSRSLKGDSLYYDGIAGYGKAVKNIVFRDTADKMLLHGQLGYYYKKDQRTLVTKNAYAGLGVDSIVVNEVKVPDSLWLGADTIETQMVLQKTLKLIKAPVIKKDNELGEEEREGGLSGSENAKGARPAAAAKNTNRPPAGKGAPGGSPDSNKKGAEDKKDPKGKPVTITPKGRDSLVKNSLFKDSVLKTPGKDSVVKIAAPGIKTDSAALSKLKPVSKKDSLKTDSLKAGVKIEAAKKKAPVQLGLKKKPTVKDSLAVNPLDTVTTRTLRAYHHVNVFKTNIQAKADSLFYTSADSTLRWYSNPIFWSENSQQTGDTIYMQMRNKKISSVQVIKNAFVVNVDTDSAKFNQIKGKMITGFFRDGKLYNMFVDGNAESVYFTKTDDGKKYDKMNQTISSRIKITFQNSEIEDVVPIKDVEGVTTPVADVKQDVILTGFIWKPELRPRTKKDITNPPKRVKPKKAAVKPGAKTPAKGTKAGATKLIKEKPAAGGAILKQLSKAADSLNLQQKTPAQLIDTATKALPGLMKKADSLSKQSVPLKMQ
jgi:lipopolysaccharide export system protein LptA